MFSSSVCFSMGVLIVALVVSTFSGISVRPAVLDVPTARLALAQKDFSGWRVSHYPVAEDAKTKRAHRQNLNYDDATLIVYTNGGVRVTIYIAHWKPGKMPHRLVASHTPDICWSEGLGWNCVERSTEAIGILEHGRPSSWEYRKFVRQGGDPEYALFSHLVNGCEMNYRTVGLPPWYAIFTDMYISGWDQRAEQLFVRISGNCDLAGFLRAEPVIEIIRNFEITKRRMRLELN